MSFAISSDEVAEDYTRALEDLTMNTRVEISNLTVIAQENIEHALAISEALKNHIRTTSPQKKLPALYVLDSIVKNVGTPYTIFFGRQLFNTFMQAYVLVDNNVRRKLDEMLKTWKEPVPGSIEARPVFPSDITRPIENALIKARISAVQAEQARNQQMGRGSPNLAQPPYRQSITSPTIPQSDYNVPPGYPTIYGYQQYPTPVNGQSYPNTNHYSLGQPYTNVQQYSNGQHYLAPQQYNGYPNGTSHYAIPHQPLSPHLPAQADPAAWYQQQPSQYPAYHAPESSVETLSSDIAELITESKQEFAQSPMDSNIQTRLKALLDLQNILQSRTLPLDQIELVKNQVAQLSKATRSSRTSVQPVHVTSTTPVTAAQPVVQQSSLSSLLRSGALAELLAKQSSTPPIPTPPIQNPISIQSPAVQQLPEFPYNPPAATPSSTAIPVTDPGSLLESLRAAGMLPAAPTVTSTPILPHGFSPSANLAASNAARNNSAEIPNDVVLKPASLKMPRPHLISSLYEKLGTPCTQCGRRFPSDEQGKRKRTAHMDWHFRIHQRINEAEKKGQRRSWYVDELDWIKNRDSRDEDPSATTVTALATDPSVVSKPKPQFVAVPNDPALANSVCPICQEKFEMTWLDDAQEWVWMDARKVGTRIYHASCYAEATKDGGNSAGLKKKDTPKVEGLGLESVLGKRKAEDDDTDSKTKIKLEP